MDINFLCTFCYIPLSSFHQCSTAFPCPLPPYLQIFFVSNDMLVLLCNSLTAITPFCPFWWKKTSELQVTKLLSVPYLVLYNAKQTTTKNHYMLRDTSASKQNKNRTNLFHPQSSSQASDFFFSIDISYLRKKQLIWYQQRELIRNVEMK